MACFENCNILFILICQDCFFHLLTSVRNIVQREDALARRFGELLQWASQVRTPATVMH
jgi:hypothetical protein